MFLVILERESFLFGTFFGHKAKKMLSSSLVQTQRVSINTPVLELKGDLQFFSIKCRYRPELLTTLCDLVMNIAQNPKHSNTLQTQDYPHCTFLTSTIDAHREALIKLI